MFPYACHDALDGLVERLVGAAGLKLVGTHLTQQVFECVDHGQAERDADGAAERHLETRCMLWASLSSLVMMGT